MLDKKYKADDNRLCCVADSARHVMQFFREERVRAVRLFAGNRYSTNSYLKKTFVNLLGLYVNIVSRSLISQNPQCMLSTFDSRQRPAVDGAENWLNRELKRMDFAGTMGEAVVDGLFSIGIAKIALATPADTQTQNWGLQVAQPFITPVDLDDFVFDHRARNFDEVRFIGHRYRAPFDLIHDSKRYNKKARENLEVSYQIAYNRQGDERIGQIGRDFHGYDEDLYDMVDLWEFYLPHEGVIKTFTEMDLSGPSSAWEGGRPVALLEQKWIGPETGPYQILQYGRIPGNIFPKGPIQDLLELHELANEGYRKLAREFGKLKKITACSRDNPEDGKAGQAAKDGDMVPMHDPKSIVDVTMGGGDAGLFNFVRENITRFMEQAGNLMTMGGLGPQAGTLGQEELLQQQSNGQVATMQDKTASFVERCADSLLWFHWYHPTNTMQANFDDPKLRDMNFTRHIHPANHPNPAANRRVGPKPELKIDPYSVRRSTPQQVVKDLLSIVESVYTPMAQLFAQQGKMLDLDALLQILSKNMSLPELQEIVTMGAPIEPGAGGGAAGGQQPPKETVHTRRSIGGASKQAQEMEQNNMLESAMHSGTNGKPKQMVR